MAQACVTELGVKWRVISIVFKIGSCKKCVLVEVETKYNTQTIEFYLRRVRFWVCSDIHICRLEVYTDGTRGLIGSGSQHAIHHFKVGHDL